MNTRLMRVGGRTCGVVAMVLTTAVMTACGGGGSKSSSKAAAVTTTTAPGSASVTESTVAAPSSSTTTTAIGQVASSGSTTSTTRRATTATTSRSSKLVAPSSGNVGNTPQTGLTNITSPAAVVATPGAQPGGSVNYLKGSEQITMDPVGMGNTGSFDGSPGFAVFDMILYSQNGSVIPQTAESLTSPDGVVWTLKLRPNIKFTDGTAYDAAAVKFNWTRLQDPANHGLRQSTAAAMQSMDVVDPLTLRVTLKAKNAVFPLSVQLMPFIGSPTAIQQKGDQFGNNPVGAGPFLMKSWVRDNQMVLVRNPGYWRAPLPYLDQITFTPIIDETQRLNTFCTGQANLITINAVTNADQADKQGCGTLIPLAMNGGMPIDFNVTKAPTNDLRTRQAIAMAIEPNDYSKTVNLGLIPFASSPFRPDSPFYDPGSIQPKYDPVKAQQLFDAVAAANGGTVELPVLALQSADYQANANYVAGALNKFKNVHATVVTKATTAFVQDVTTHSYAAIAVLGTTFDDPDPTWTGIFQCNSNPNITGYCNPQFDQAIVDSQNQLDPAKRLAALKAALKVHQADVPQFFLRNAYSWNAAAKNLQDFAYINDGAALVDRIWIKR